MSFKTRLNQSVAKNNSLVCVGLDSEVAKLPAKFQKLKEPQYEFNKAIVDATAGLVCAYKPNSAFYEAEGASGIEQLRKTVAYIHDKYPNVPVILDAKRADIGNTNNGYVKFLFEYLDLDAVTVQPYLGGEALEPFLACKDKGIIVLCKTSNPGSGELQDIDVNGKKVYQIVAETVRDEWDTNKNCLLVTGATYPEELKDIRAIMGDDYTFLVPGIGAQGGDIQAMVRAGVNAYGDGIIVNSARDIIFASNGEDFAKTARAKTDALREEINKYRFTELVMDLHTNGIVKFGEFTFKSGIVSPMYIDLRMLVANPGTMSRVAKAYTGMLNRLKFDRMAAVPYAAMPIVAAISAENGEPWIYTRKEAKGYGTNKMIEGGHQTGETIVVVDDLVTNGDSKFEVIAPFEKAGLKVTDTVVLLDYQKGAKEKLAKKGYALHAALTVPEVIDTLHRENAIDDEMYAKVKDFLAQQVK
ncbi:orotidine-5'-phosphate decarboxylase [Candidatus Saccharibacteria bacterium]|nr:orotidine-5'-phosphate decarboxylase [Candidatus Saccharibacteria bacterium]